MPDDPLRDLLALPGVADAAADARSAVDRLRAHRVLRRRSAKVAAESALHAVRASAALAGSDHSLAAVRSGSLRDPVLTGALRCSGALGALAATWPRAPLQALARLHTLAAADLTDTGSLGRPDPAAAGRLQGLAQVITASSPTPVVIRAAIVHGELLALAPFREGNSVVARAATRLAMVTGGLDPQALSVPEVGHAEQAAEYRQAAQDYAAGGETGVGSWLLHCCSAVTHGATEGIAICEALSR